MVVTKKRNKILEKRHTLSTSTILNQNDETIICISSPVATRRSVRISCRRDSILQKPLPIMAPKRSSRLSSRLNSHVHAEPQSSSISRRNPVLDDALAVKKAVAKRKTNKITGK